MVAPGIAVVRANVPHLIDRPQLVLRSDGNHVALSDQYRWAETAIEIAANQKR